MHSTHGSVHTLCKHDLSMSAHAQIACRWLLHWCSKQMAKVGERLHSTQHGRLGHEGDRQSNSTCQLLQLLLQHLLCQLTLWRRLATLDHCRQLDQQPMRLSTICVDPACVLDSVEAQQRLPAAPGDRERDRVCLQAVRRVLPQHARQLARFFQWLLGRHELLTLGVLRAANVV